MTINLRGRWTEDLWCSARALVLGTVEYRGAKGALLRYYGGRWTLLNSKGEITLPIRAVSVALGNCPAEEIGDLSARGPYFAGEVMAQEAKVSAS